MSEPKKTPKADEPQAPAGVYDIVLAILGDLGEQGIAKTGWNDHSKYKFRSIEDVLATFNRLMTKYRLLIIPSIETQVPERNGKNMYVTVTMRYEFRSLVDGSNFAMSYAGCGGDVGDKAIGKAQTNALKQMLTDLFKIPAEGMTDGDADTPDRNEAEEAAKREELAAHRAREQARDRLLATGARKGLDADGVIAWCQQQYNAHPKSATVQDLVMAEAELDKAMPDKPADEQQGRSRPQGSDRHPAGKGRPNGAARPPQQRGNGQQGGGRPQGKAGRPGIPGQRPGSEPQQ
jgi:ERF superfamily protein